MGRLIGVGLLVGVGLATLALLFLNMSSRHGAASEPVGRGARVRAAQRAAHAAGGNGLAIVRGGSRRASAPRSFTSSGLAPERRPRSRLTDEAALAGDSDRTLRVQRVWLAPLRPSDNAALASVIQLPAPVEGEPTVPESLALGGVKLPTQAAAGPSVQDEFGFER